MFELARLGRYSLSAFFMPFPYLKQVTLLSFAKDTDFWIWPYEKSEFQQNQNKYFNTKAPALASYWHCKDTRLLMASLNTI
jgi:hypothetical protein